MDRLLGLVRDYPAVGGIALFLAISLLVGGLLAVMMLRAGVSLRPLIFLFGFVGIVGVPQAAVHLLDAAMTARARATESAATASSEPRPEAAPPAADGLKPVPWAQVFGPEADPSLISDAMRGLAQPLAGAQQAQLSFSSNGESALAARFDSAADAQAALNRYGSFFQFADVRGSDVDGWTARRYGGQGEWNHVVTAGKELYAWTAASEARVVERRVAALGPLRLIPTAAAGESSHPTPASGWLQQRPALLAAFVAINLVMATLWFFKASAWAMRVEARSGVPVADAAALRQRLGDLADAPLPLSVRPAPGGTEITIDWPYADARWFDLMRVHQMRRTQRLVLTLDTSAKVVRVSEYWSRFDASAGPSGLHFNWQRNVGMQMFAVESTTVIGAQLDADGRPTGEWIKTFRFDAGALKQPVIDVVTGAGWDWQPVMWRGPVGLRWLTG